MNNEVMNLLHFPACFLLARFIPISHFSSVSIMGAWFFLPIVVELCQWWVGRTCDIVDAIWGVWGIIFGMLWHKLHYSLRTLCLLPYSIVLTKFFVVNLYPLWHLPLVSNMESKLLMAQISNVGERRENTITQKWLQTKRSSVLTLSKQTYPWTGIRVSYPWGADMASYNGLKFKLKSESVPLKIDVKISDNNNYKIKTKEITSTHWTEVLVEFDSSAPSLDWSNIDHFAVYYASENGPEFIEIDNLKFY